MNRLQRLGLVLAAGFSLAASSVRAAPSDALFGFLTLGKTTQKEVRAVFQKAECPVREGDNVFSVPRGCLALPGTPSAKIFFEKNRAEAVTLSYQKEDFFPGAETFPQYYAMMNEWLGKPQKASRSLFGGGVAVWNTEKLSAELVEKETSFKGTLTVLTQRYRAVLRKKELLEELKNSRKLTPL